MDNDKDISVETSLALIYEKLANINKKVDKIETALDRDYISQDEFLPVKNIVYGMVFLMLTGVISSILFLVLK